MIAAFAAPYGALNGWAVIAAIEATLTIAPPPWARRCGSVCLQERNVPPAWTPSIRFQRSSDHSSIGPKSAWPGRVEDAVDPAQLGARSSRRPREPTSSSATSTWSPIEPSSSAATASARPPSRSTHGDATSFGGESPRDGLREPRPARPWRRAPSPRTASAETSSGRTPGLGRPRAVPLARSITPRGTSVQAPTWSVAVASG